MENFVLNDDHHLVMCLLMLCKTTKDTDPYAYAQYKAHLKHLEEMMMKEFDDENVGNLSSH